MAFELNTLRRAATFWWTGSSVNAVLFAVDPATGDEVPLLTTQFGTTGASGTPAGVPGNGVVLSQTAGTITTASQALTGIPAGANFAQLQFHGAGVSARYDAAAASNSAAEEVYAAGGMLRLTNAADIAGFRYIGTVAGSFSIIFRSY